MVEAVRASEAVFAVELAIGVTLVGGSADERWGERHAESVAKEEASLVGVEFAPQMDMSVPLPVPRDVRRRAGVRARGE